MCCNALTPYFAVITALHHEILETHSGVQTVLASYVMGEEQKKSFAGNGCGNLKDLRKTSAL